ncbi:hypothetical protein ACFY0A_41480 [Streptomyces sp. NPDC001698]|uniref:hypothetical protein n=1 Tax=unclassified Streptomyces TaxID=2593676 RepID=UPI00367ABA87
MAALAVAQVDQSPIGNQVPEKSVGPVDDVDKGACSTKVTKDLGQRITQVNAAGVRWSGATTDFVCRAGATSTLGVAVSLTGKAGDWKAGGSSAKGVSTTATLYQRQP